MSGYEVLGIATANGIVYIICSALLGLVLCCLFTGDDVNGGDLDKFYEFAWIAGCIVYVAMALYYT